MIKKILIGLAVLVGLLVLFLIVSTRGMIFTGGVPLGGVTFSEEKVVNFPVYLGAKMTTDDKGITVPEDLRRVVGDKEDRWNRYLTDQSKETVIAWYQTATVEAGLGELAARSDAGAYIVAQGDTRWALYVTSAGGTTSIVIGSGKE